jgi:oligopeptidase A
LDYARPAQEEEIRNLEQYAIEHGFNAKNGLELYDMAYWKRRQLQSVFDYDEETLKEYFPIPKVIEHLLKLSENLFEIKIVERVGTVDTWHEDVRYFDIFDSRDDYRTPVAGFYLDLYSREDEKLLAHENQGYVVGIRNRSSLTKTNPLAALIFNFQTPLYGKPSCLSVDDLKMLAFKFGHAFQHLLTRVEYSELSGLSNVEWDAVEISGHVMAHLLNNPKTLKSISSHYANDDKITEKQCEIIKNYWQHLSGYNLSRELYVAALDLELHSSKDFWLDVVKRMWPEYYVFPLDKKDAHPCSMTSIFSGEWGSAYFSHGKFHNFKNPNQLNFSVG